MAFFSVIIPNYNTECFIVRCLKALEQQTFKDFEVIIIDDCSTDNSVEVIRQFIAQTFIPITLLRNRINLGPAKTREEGLRHCKGRYVAFCDSDDWYDFDYLQAVYDRLRKAQTDIVFVGYKTVHLNGQMQKKQTHPIPQLSENPVKAEVLRLPVDSLCSLVIKTDVIQKIDMPNIRNGEDMALIPILICASDSYATVNICPYNYLYRRGSASLTANMRVVDSLIESYNYIFNTLSENYPVECEYLGIRNLLYAALLNLFKFSFDTQKADRIISDFSERYPNWKNNPYFMQLPQYKKILILTAANRCYALTTLFARVHTLLTR